MRGPRSLAGLIANPVVPPNENPIAVINKPMTNGFKPSAKLFAPIKDNPNIKRKVPITSLARLFENDRTAGIVEKTAIVV